MRYSQKVDTFSFGLTALEVLSGQRSYIIHQLKTVPIQQRMIVYTTNWRPRIPESLRNESPELAALIEARSTLLSALHPSTPKISLRKESGAHCATVPQACVAKDPKDRPEFVVAFLSDSIFSPLPRPMNCWQHKDLAYEIEIQAHSFEHVRALHLEVPLGTPILTSYFREALENL